MVDCAAIVLFCCGYATYTFSKISVIYSTMAAMSNREHEATYAQ